MPSRTVWGAVSVARRSWFKTEIVSDRTSGQRLCTAGNRSARKQQQAADRWLQRVEALARSSLVLLVEIDSYGTVEDDSMPSLAPARSTGRVRVASRMHTADNDATGK